MLLVPCEALTAFCQWGVARPARGRVSSVSVWREGAGLGLVSRVRGKSPWLWA